MATRPIFRRFDTFVVVRPLRLSSKVILKPGKKISYKDYPTYRLRNWYQRGRLAKAGCAWAEAILKGRFPGSVQKEEKPKEPEQPTSANFRIDQSGSWFTVFNGDEQVAKMQGRAALDAWLEENDRGSEAV